jgi:hypothetical protein
MEKFQDHLSAFGSDAGYELEELLLFCNTEYQFCRIQCFRAVQLVAATSFVLLMQQKLRNKIQKEVSAQQCCHSFKYESFLCSHVTLRSGVADYVIFLTTMYGMIFQ